MTMKSTKPDPPYIDLKSILKRRVGDDGFLAVHLFEVAFDAFSCVPVKVCLDVRIDVIGDPRLLRKLSDDCPITDTRLYQMIAFLPPMPVFLECMNSVARRIIGVKFTSHLCPRSVAKGSLPHLPLNGAGFD